MTPVYHWSADGFTCGDRDSGVTAYAYPSSPAWRMARKEPTKVATEMLQAESSAPSRHSAMAKTNKKYQRAIKDYDAQNWATLERKTP